VNSDATIQLRHLFEIVSGSTPESGNADYWDGDIAWVTPEDVSQVDSNVLRDTRRKLTAEGFANSGTTMACAGGIVLTKRAPIGQLALLGLDACSNQGCFLLSAREGIEPRFFYYVLTNSVPLLQALGRGSTFMELSADDLKALRVPVLAYDQQVKLANYLDAWVAKVDELLQSKRELLQILGEKRKAIIATAVTRGLEPKVKLRDSGVPWLGEIPAHWSIAPLRYLLSFGPKNGISPPQSGSDGALSFSISAVRDGRVTIEGNEKSVDLEHSVARNYYIKSGDILLVRGNGNLSLVGTCGLVETAPDECTYPDILMLMRAGERVVAELLVAAINSPYVREQIESIAQTTNGTYKLSGEDVRTLRLAVPPLDEQRAIVGHLTRETATLDAVRAATERTIALLKERRSALIASAVTGQLNMGAAT
jgi:type I restriction enzyme S subunit